MTERGIDGIYLRPNENLQGGHLIMNLNTGKRISRPRVTAIPLTAHVKQHVEEMALTEGITTIKITNKDGVELPNVDDKYGIEYSDAYDEENYDKDYVQPQTVVDLSLIHI